LAFLNIQF